MTFTTQYNQLKPNRKYKDAQWLDISFSPRSFFQGLIFKRLLPDMSRQFSFSLVQMIFNCGTHPLIGTKNNKNKIKSN